LVDRREFPVLRGTSPSLNSGANVTTTFNGVRLGLIGTKARAYGQALVWVDGRIGVIDFYNPSTCYGQAIWSTGFPAPGDHVFTIAWAGAKNRRARGTTINLDAVAVVGTLLTPAGPS
jgi:hypothetical protein